MQEGEEPDTCRICSAPAEPDQPLFHPCKCSGTIRYIHQDCLTTWLAHSKKKTCDVCKHAYSFTKVYAPDMPSHIPPLLLIRRILQQLLFGVLFILRAIAVAIIWLAFLPWVTVWTWRMYFAVGESAAWWISDRPRPLVQETMSNSTTTSYSLFHKFRFQLIANPPAISKGTILERITSHPAWISLSADIFTGQIIAALIVLTFVAIFLLREWITQNARPGLFDDDLNDLAGVEDPVNLPPPPPPPEPPLPRIDPPEIEGFPEADLARRQQQAIRVMDAFRLQDTPYPEPPHPDCFGEDADERDTHPARRADEILKRARFGDVEHEQGVPIARVMRPDQKRRARLAASAAARTKAKAEATQSVGQNQPKFTFSFPLQSPTEATGATEKMPLSEIGNTSTNAPGPSFFPSTHLHPQPLTAEEIPFRLKNWKMTSRTSSTDTLASAEGVRNYCVPEDSEPPIHEAKQPSADPSASTSIPFTPTWIPPWAGPAEPGSSRDPDAAPATAEDTTSSANKSPIIDSRREWAQKMYQRLEENPPQAATTPSPTSATNPPPPLLGPFELSAQIRGAQSSQRPPLPSSVFPSPISEHGAAGVAGSGGAKSPGLATYRPPEEPLFEQQDYFFESQQQPQQTFGGGNGYVRAAPPPPLSPMVVEDPLVRNAQKRREQGRREWDAMMADGNSTDSQSEGEDEDKGVAGIALERGRNGKGKARQVYDQEEDDEEEEEAGAEESGDFSDRGGYYRDWDQPAYSDEEADDRRQWDYDGEAAGSEDGNGETREMDKYFRDGEEPDDALRRMLAEPGDGGRPPEHVMPMLMNARAHIVDDRPPAQEGDEPFGGPAAAANNVAGGQGGEGMNIDDDLDGNVEDDMEGAMEAIGMRGPIHGVLQNAALMIFVLDTAIGLCIWVPFTIGKTTALLSLNPPRLLQIIHFPIKAMRFVTDPLVDVVVFLVNRFVIPPLLDVAKGSVNLTLLFVQKLLGKKVADSVLEMSNRLYDQSKEFLSDPLARLPFLATSNQTVTPPVDSEHIFPVFAQPLEPHFEVLGRHVRLTGEKAQDSWIRLALGHGPAERVFAIFLGYVVVGLMLAAYLNVLTVGNARTAGRAVRNAVRQQLLVLKVAGFIFIELVLFPLGCGVVLDICTVWLFPEANLLSRVAFFAQAPLTAVFYHWVAGTMFMYSFAILLSSCRSVMRPGAMWFIKDPQDQNSHPIRDILERPTFLQLRKIMASAVMYAIVVAAVVGSVAGLLLLGSKSIMPFRWKNREPLSSIPVDLLFLHLVLPQTLHYFRPRRAMKALATRVWRLLATKLRLTSYFFGGRYPSEEYTSGKWPFPWSPAEDDSDKQRMDGTFRRVPATDHLALPREMKATAEVTAEGFPIDEENARLMETQNEEARKAKHEIDKDYMVVFIPTGFRYRILSFMLLLWTVGALFIGVSVALPVQLGRSFFTLFTTREVHDGYSFIVGFYSLWACYLVGKAVDRLEKQHRRLQEAYGDKPLPKDIRILAVKRSLFWMGKMAYLGVFLGAVIPILLAFVMDLYVVLPIRSTFTPGETPRIRVVDNWALGLLYGKILMHLSRLQPQHHVVADIQRVLERGWMAVDAVEATMDVIAPLSAGLVGMILLPALLLQAGRLVLARVGIDAPFMHMSIYPAIFVFAAVIKSVFLFYELLSGWSQSIRDKEFLVELRLKNHEPEALAPKDTSSLTSGSDERTQTVQGAEALEVVEELQAE